MKVRAQIAMVLNLDKCIGCHTCSITCKNVWTNREGVEYAWFNNVETRPGLGYPRRYEDQEEWQGGWVRKPNGRLVLRAGGRLQKLANIFSNPKMPSIDDYYEPWTYDYETLTNSPATDTFPVAQPHSVLTGEPMQVQWSANWDDNLGGSQEVAARDEMLKGIEDKVKFEFEQTFMFYLPRICEHCLNPSCAASCPSGAIYKREEDGIVLVDQDGCRGWRMCITGCPYKKIYFNHRTGKAEKLSLSGLPGIGTDPLAELRRKAGKDALKGERSLQVINLDWNAGKAALAAGLVDAVWGGVSLLALRGDKIDVVVKSGDSGRQNTTQAGFLGTQTFIDAWPQATQQIVNVLVKNAAEISDPANRDAWSAEMAQQSQIPQALFLEELQPQDLNFTTSPRIDPFLTDSFSNSVEQAKSGRLIRSAFDVSQWVDGQFVEQALKAQGLENRWPQYDAKGQAKNAG